MNEIKNISPDIGHLSNHLVKDCDEDTSKACIQRIVVPRQKRGSAIQGNIQVADRITRSISYLIYRFAVSGKPDSNQSACKNVARTTTTTTETIESVDTVDLSGTGHLLSVIGGGWGRG